jgi:hypothetical protein
MQHITVVDLQFDGGESEHLAWAIVQSNMFSIDIGIVNDSKTISWKKC